MSARRYSRLDQARSHAQSRLSQLPDCAREATPRVHRVRFAAAAGRTAASSRARASASPCSGCSRAPRRSASSPSRAPAPPHRLHVVRRLHRFPRASRPQGTALHRALLHRLPSSRKGVSFHVVRGSVFDVARQPCVSRRSDRRRTVEPRVVGRHGDAQNAAGDLNGKALRRRSLGSPRTSFGSASLLPDYGSRAPSRALGCAASLPRVQPVRTS